MDALGYNRLKRFSGVLTNVPADALEAYLAAIRTYGEAQVRQALEDIVLDCTGGLCSAGPSRGGGGGGGGGGGFGGGQIGPPGPPGGTTPPVPTAYEKLARFICAPTVRALLVASGNSTAAKIAAAVTIACAAGRMGDVDWTSVCAMIKSLPDAITGGPSGANVVIKILKKLCGGTGEAWPPQLKAAGAALTTQATAFEEQLYPVIFEDPRTWMTIGALLPPMDEDVRMNGLKWLLALAADLPSEDLEVAMAASGADWNIVTEAEELDPTFLSDWLLDVYA